MTAPTPPAVPDWLEAAVEAGARAIRHEKASCGVDGAYNEDLARAAILAAFPHITHGAADAVEADGIEAAYALTGREAYIEAATIVRNFGSEVGRA